MSPKIENRQLSGLIPYARNSRKHSDSQINQIAASIKEFGFLSPCVISSDGTIIAGHGRVLAAMKAGLDSVPCVIADHLTEGQRRAYVLIDNRLTDTSEWDKEMLQLELGDLALEYPDIDISEMGFSSEEIAELDLNLMGDKETEGLTDPDDVPEPPKTPTTNAGDIWLLGNHRVMCGDSTDAASVALLMTDQNADMVFTDPPYGMNAVSKDGKVGGGTVHAPARVYRPVVGDEDTSVARLSCSILKDLKVPKMFIWGGNYFTDFLPPSPCWIIWDKQRPEGLTFADGEVAWTNLTTPLKFIRHRWDGYHRASERDQDRVHPTQKPAFLAEWCFKEYGTDNDCVLDLFLGSGSTLIACEKTARRCFGMEIDPHYCDVIIKRWQDFTGRLATLEGDGRSFEEIQRERVG